jgi:RimJ/RimL family protein N-acetyltransferase
MRAATSVALVATTVAHLDCEARSAEALCSALNVALPPSWPPEHFDAAFRDWLRQALQDEGNAGGWHNHYVIADGRLAGTAGFKGPPRAGVVEIGYSVVPELQGRGIAMAAVRQLLQRAFSDPSVARVTAETLPHLIASQAVLHGCGFRLTGAHPADGGETILSFAMERPQR